MTQHASTLFLLAPLTLTDMSHFWFSMGMSQVPPTLTPAMPQQFVGVDPVCVHTRPEQLEQATTTCDNISAIQSLYGVSSDSVTALSMFSDHSDHCDAT